MATPPITWRGHYEPGVPHGLGPLTGAFPRLLADAGAAAPSQTALVCYRRRWSYAQLEARATLAAGAWLRLGLQTGDRVAVCLPNLPSACELLLGLLRAGGIIVSLPWGAEPEEVAAALATCPPRFVVTATGERGRAAAEAAPPGGLILLDLRADLPLLLRWIGRLSGGEARRSGGRASRGRLPRHRRWDRLMAQARPGKEPELTSESPALERPVGDRALTFSHGNLVNGAQMLRLWLSDAVPGEDSWLPLLPLSSVMGLVVILGAAPLARARVLLLPCPDGESLGQLSRWLPPAYAFSDRATLRALAEDPHLPEADLDTLRAWIVSEVLTREERDAFETATGLELCQGLAPAEAAGLLLCNPINGQRRPGACGLLLPGASARVAQGADGKTELAFQAPNLSGTGWRQLGTGLTADAEGYLYPGLPPAG